MYLTQRLVIRTEIQIQCEKKKIIWGKWFCFQVKRSWNLEMEEGGTKEGKKNPAWEI